MNPDRDKHRPPRSTVEPLLYRCRLVPGSRRTAVQRLEPPKPKVLALIEEDLGRDVARAVTRTLVVYYRRPGGQMQYSSLLELDPQSDRIGAALAFMREHLAEPLSLDRVADAVHLSTRQFGRAFLQSTGMTPAKAIERLRVEAARPSVEDGRETLDGIARKNGFGDADRMRESFLRLLGQPPQTLRSLARQTDAGLRRRRVSVVA